MKDIKEVRQIHDLEGNLVGEAEYLNGKLHGYCKIWNSEGILMQSFMCDHGLKQGDYSAWWDNGKIMEVGRYDNGEKKGLYVWYNRNGVKLTEHFYE